MSEKSSFEAEWLEGNGLGIDKCWEFDLRNEEHLVYQGRIKPEATDRLVLSTLYFWVPEDMRERGIGTSGFRAALALAKSYGTETIENHIESPYALMIRKHIFGDGMTFYDCDLAGELEPDAEPIPVSTDQAIMSLERSNAIENTVYDTDLFEMGWQVVADLSKIDTCSWELPLEINKPAGLNKRLSYC